MKSDLKELLFKIDSMTIGDLVDFREKVTRSDIDVYDKRVILKLIKERTNPKIVGSV